MQQCRYRSPFISYVKESELFNEQGFTLVDVGASGGIDSLWRQLEPGLQGVGFDPLVSEVEKLNAEEKNSRFSYVDGWITCNDKTILAGKEGSGFHSNISFHHTSAAKAAEIMSLDYIKEHFNAGEPLVYSEEHFSLDDYTSKAALADVDFIKVDTDGHDYFVLHGAEKTIKTKGVLGLQVECQMHGSLHPHANIFSNIDLYLRQLGFTLFDLDCWRYTHAAMPGQFCYPFAAQTTSGHIQFADALYVLDPVTNPELLDAWLDNNQFSKLLNLLCIYDLFAKGDSAAAVINMLLQRGKGIPGLDLGKMLDLLVPKNQWGIKTYKEYIDKFNQNPRDFYPPK